MVVAIPPVPDRDNREPSSRQPRDWEADWSYLTDRFASLMEDMEKRHWTEDEVFEELIQYYGRDTK